MSPDGSGLGVDVPADVEEAIDRYRDQGGLLGAVTYALLYLETGDEAVATEGARIPTALFVASSLHDDAIDECHPGVAGDARSFLNYRVTTGDLFFTTAIEAVAALPDDFDATTITSAVRAIGTGQLREETTPIDGGVAGAIERVEQRGSVWGELVVGVVEAADRYSDEQLERLYAVVADLLFVFALLDDVEDLREDVANGVVTAPVLLYEAESTDDPESVTVESILDSDVPARLEAIVEGREARIEDAARRFHADLARTDREVLDALDRALSWYCDSICSVPVSETVPPSVQADVRTALADEESRRRYLEDVAADTPIAILSGAEIPDPVCEIPTADLAPLLIRSLHVSAIVDAELATSLDDALSSLRTASSSAE